MAVQQLSDGSPDGTLLGRSDDLIGFFGATTVDKAGATEDLKDLLVAYGLMTDSGATPLNLDGGDITCDGITATSLSVSGLASFASDISITASGDLTVDTVTATSLAISGLSTFSGSVTMGDNEDIILQTTTGTMIGTATDQKLGLWAATPVVQPTNADQAAVTASAGTTSNSAYVASLQSLATANKTLVNRLRTDLVAVGVIKGS
jgi:hypothetical protein